MVDTHAHLTSPKYINIKKVIGDAKKEGVTKIVTIGISVLDSKENIKIAERFPNVFASVGIYPHDNENKNCRLDSLFGRLEILAKHPKVVAIGECGLDFANPAPYEKKRSKSEQEKIFQFQINLSKKIKKPLIIHSRLAAKETFKMLALNFKPKTYEYIPGTWHSFVDDLKTAQQIINLGFFISFNGIITYKNGETVHPAVKGIPLNKILIETDSPYLTPEPIRNKVKLNEPKYVKLIAKEIARIKQNPLSIIKKQTTSNSCALFNI